MAKQKSAESEEARLKKKIAAKRTERETGPALRSLVKRLKREQRKRRALAFRKTQAAGKRTDAAPTTA